MKKIAKVFIIIGMVLQCFLIFPVVLGIIALKKIDKAQSKSDLTVWAIITLLFVNMVGGILMLVIPDSEFQPAEQTTVTVEVQSEE
jgi:uncharacterized membrane-anchored protein